MGDGGWGMGLEYCELLHAKGYFYFKFQIVIKLQSEMDPGRSLPGLHR